MDKNIYTPVPSLTPKGEKSRVVVPPALPGMASGQTSSIFKLFGGDSLALGKKMFDPLLVQPGNDGHAAKGSLEWGSLVSDLFSEPPIITHDWEALCGWSDLNLVEYLNAAYALDMILLGLAHPATSKLTDLQDERWSMMRIGLAISQDNLIDVMAEHLEKYAFAAIGGEVRYHRLIGGKFLPLHRKSAWAGWLTLAETHDRSLMLRCAETLFYDFSSGNYGGPKWAAAAEHLRKYIDGEYTAREWVDRCVNLEHNTGSFLNKISWGGAGLSGLKGVLYNHSAKEPDFDRFVQGADQKDYFSGVIDDINAIAAKRGLDVVLPPDLAPKPLNAYSPGWWHAKVLAIGELVDEVEKEYLIGALKATPAGGNWAEVDSLYVKNTYLNANVPYVREHGFWKWLRSIAPHEANAATFVNAEYGLWAPLERMWRHPHLPDAVRMGDGLFHIPKIPEGEHAKVLLMASGDSVNEKKFEALDRWQWWQICATMQKHNLFIRKYGNAHGKGYVLTDKEPKKKTLEEIE